MTKSVFNDIMKVASGKEVSEPTGPDQILIIEVIANGGMYAKWREFVLEYDDLFDDYHIGDWAECVVRSNERGLLIVDAEAFRAFFDEEEEAEEIAEKMEEAVNAWEKGLQLPEYFYSIDDDVIKETFTEGVKLNGLEWFECSDCDGPYMGRLIQNALFGHVEYDND